MCEHNENNGTTATIKKEENTHVTSNANLRSPEPSQMEMEGLYSGTLSYSFDLCCRNGGSDFSDGDPVCRVYFLKRGGKP